MVIVETPRLVLRPPEGDDAAPLMAIHQPERLERTEVVSGGELLVCGVRR